ncbi:MAG: branched-chain amino acid aminotransferase [Acidimicrobiales bacterium]|nr:branched-chain amino acid aminotransferase [Acidimicrobiales bacterium]
MTAASLGFGKHFSAHMATALFADGTWSGFEVAPFGNLSLSPAAMVLHYGQAVFEGLKAFRQADGSVALFRPGDNARRFNASARRLAMPELPDGLFVGACEAVVLADASSIPTGDGESFYLRPMIFATEPALGVRAADEYSFIVLGSPVGAYFGDTVRAISVWADPSLVRAAPGGTGAAKCSGNYAASLIAKSEAVSRGCDEALWLDAREHHYVEELGGMNFVALEQTADGPRLVTPPLSDTILDGITRRSLLALATHLGYKTDERAISLDDLRSGAFVEAFACGTAAVVVPIGRVVTADSEIIIADGQPGTITMLLRTELVALQEGRSPDPFGWRHPLNA